MNMDKEEESYWSSFFQDFLDPDVWWAGLH